MLAQVSHSHLLCTCLLFIISHRITSLSFSSVVMTTVSSWVASVPAAGPRVWVDCLFVCLAPRRTRFTDRDTNIINQLNLYVMLMTSRIVTSRRPVYGSRSFLRSSCVCVCVCVSESLRRCLALGLPLSSNTAEYFIEYSSKPEVEIWVSKGPSCGVIRTPVGCRVPSDVTRR